jgi:hypothetical protein
VTVGLGVVASTANADVTGARIIAVLRATAVNVFFMPTV